MYPLLVAVEPLLLLLLRCLSSVMVRLIPSSFLLPLSTNGLTLTPQCLSGLKRMAPGALANAVAVAVAHDDWGSGGRSGCVCPVLGRSG